MNVSDFNAWRQEFVELDQFYQGMQEVHIEKCLEHYLSFILLDLSSKDVFIDIAAAGSIFAGLLKRKFGLESYRLDLIYPQGINGNEIGANAVYTALPSEFATALTLHCAYECFVGETDITFMDEAERILAPEGRLVIVPLYLNDTYFISTSPYCNLKEVLIDPGACKVWRDDEYHEPFSRHYSPETFADRIYKNMPQTLNGTIYFVSNLPELIRCYPGQRIYAYFLFKADKL